MAKTSKTVPQKEKASSSRSAVDKTPVEPRPEECVPGVCVLTSDFQIDKGSLVPDRCKPVLSLGKDAVLRPPSGEEEMPALVPKPAKDHKRKRASTFEDPQPKTRVARKPRENTILLTEESVRCPRDEEEEEEEEEEENDASILVAQAKKSIDAPKAAGSMASVVHQEACSRSRAELSRYEADLRRATEERHALKLFCGKREEEIREIRAELAKAHQDQTYLTGIKERISVQARKIEELEACLASELAKAKAEAEKAKAEADALMAVYRVDAEAAQRETLEEIHAQGFDLTEEIKGAKELEIDAGALASNDDDDDESMSGSESGEELDGEEAAPRDNQEP
ncbi:uncharacterized protein [Nicotiana tomentosiformis]|uniref:uncharacterized protein n=1 Tax=Nicotiana tomentosiformis TaxID=4098 RepID=UPI00388CCCA4